MTRLFAFVSLFLSAFFSATIADSTTEQLAMIVESNIGGGAPSVYYSPPIQATGVTKDIYVGGASLTYNESYIFLNKGDVIRFIFMMQNHTITQSTFAQPCTKLEGGVDSGFMPNKNNTMNPAPYTMLMVLDHTMPIWFYCAQTGHCSKGMVFSINPSADQTQDMFVQNALNTAMASSSVVAPLASTSTVMPTPPAATQGVNIVQGSGSTDSGTCMCSCLCGVAAFPAGDGIGMVGGMSGTLPISAVGAMC